ncbi:MAG: thiamine-phosphate kinase [Candidatus Latescibacterota bacterium]|nr:MAG: thiamine-phosphate kinase [Candidatus Latescibacterota bacterium]
MRRLQKTSEKELLRSFVRMIRAKKTPTRGIIVGAGDDTAVVRPKSGEDLLVTTDILVENRHFKRGWFTGRELGWRLAAVNLSDIAAMGGKPLYGTLSLALPSQVGVDFVRGVERGVRDHLAAYGATIVGGNVSGIQRTIVCDLSLVGSCAKGRAWRRRCRPGRDAIVVVGSLGEARAGLDLLERGVRPRFSKKLIRAFKKPRPLLAVANLLRNEKAIHGAIDVSDGLSTDLIHICENSDAGCVIDAGTLPISKPLEAFCDKYGKDPTGMALNGGEDYALILSVDSAKARVICSRIKSALGLPARVIGRFTGDDGVYQITDVRGRRRKFEAKGWDHLSSRK